MKLESTIVVTVSDSDEATKILKLFETEDTVLANDRAQYEVKIEGVTVRFRISADDPVALRAALNAITKVLTVYNKMGSIQD
ncbi:MAG: KEOPS complex subunit Pcc1 [Candidatus Woesearchaeota archaeon]